MVHNCQLLAYFDEVGPHGGGARHVIQIDHFFGSYIAPGDSFALARSGPREHSSASADRISPLRPADEPKAEVRVQYVQFVDGSTFGEETIAKEVLDLRSVILDALRRLDNAGSEKVFRALLAQKIQPDDADSFLEEFRHTEKHHGTAAARAQVRTGLTVVNERVSALRGVQAAQK